ncbi:ionotropic receptor 93a isoform X2 [Lycorma delicatula]|uniref:ionotropic receptor 93a isoform X2 n=1 Tax=Lycorma delicatula TaxID=130591 RepID=UPI003F518342
MKLIKLSITFLYIIITVIVTALSISYNINDDSAVDVGKNLTLDISIVLSLAKCSNTWELFERLQGNDLLFISITDGQCPRLPTTEAITFPMVKPGQELPQLLLDLRTSSAISWKSFSLLFDRSMDDDDIKTIVEAMTKEVPNGLNYVSALVTLHRLNHFKNEWKRQSNLEKVMKNITQFEINQNLLMIVEYDMINFVLDIAKSEKVLHPTLQCLFVIRDSETARAANFSSFVSQFEEGMNIAFMYNVTTQTSPCFGGVLCRLRELLNNLGLALQKSIQDELELSKQVSDEEWDAIKPSKVDRRNTLLNFISAQIRNEGACDNCTFWKLAAGEIWGQDYLDTKATDLLFVGSWNPREGPVLLDELFPHSKHGFRSRRLPVATFHFPPWHILYINESGHVVDYKGLVFEIIKLLATKLNFTYDVIVPTNTSLSGFTNSTKYMEHSLETLEGEQDESALSGVWNKVIDVVKNKKVFLGACAFTVTDARKAIVNFTSPISIEPYVFLSSRPKELSRALLFMSPFTASTWYCIVAAVALITPVLFIINRASPYYEGNKLKKSIGFNSPMTCFWYIYGALLQQGGGALPAADSSRLVIGTWWLVVLVVVTTYSGNLVAFLTFPKMDKLITNVDELLAKKDHVTWGIPVNSTLENLLKVTDDPKLHELYVLAKLDKTISKDLIKNVKDGLHVYIQRKTSLLFLMKHEFLSTNSCHFALGNEEFLSEHLAMAIAQDSPYLKIINKQIGWMHRVGLINKWLQDYLPKKDRCSASIALNEVTNHKVNLNDMQGSFFVLLLGFTGSFFLIVAEFLIRKYFEMREKRVIQPFVS